MLVLATKWEEEVFNVENITEINLQIIKARALKTYSYQSYTIRPRDNAFMNNTHHVPRALFIIFYTMYIKVRVLSTTLH